MAERDDHELVSKINALWASQIQAIPAGWIPRGVAPNVVEFLTTVGLPTTTVQGIEFVHDNRMSYLIDHLHRGYLLLSMARARRASCVADPGDGQVSIFSGGLRPHLVFVNSSLPRLLVALGVWRRDVWERTVAGMAGEELLAAYERFERGLADLDPAAAETGAHWPDLLEGLREGIER